MAKELRGRRVRHICSVPFCSNKDTMIFSRSADIGHGQHIYICAECAKDMAALYKAKAKKGKEKSNDDN